MRHAYRIDWKCASPLLQVGALWERCRGLEERLQGVQAQAAAAEAALVHAHAAAQAGEAHREQSRAQAREILALNEALQGAQAAAAQAAARLAELSVRCSALEVGSGPLTSCTVQHAWQDC